MFSRTLLLTGMPRSGTSWLSQIFDSHPEVRFRLSPLFSYEFKNQLDEHSTRADWEALLRAAYDSGNEFMDQTRRRASGEYPVFKEKAVHPSLLVVKDTRFHNLTRQALTLLPHLTVVSIVRHPCGAIHSWLTSRGEFPAGADPMQEWRSGQCRKTGYGEFWGFDDWKLVTAGHLDLEQEFPRRFHLVRYEDLVADPLAVVRQMFDFAGLVPGEQTLAFVAASHSQHVDTDYAVFKDPKVSRRWMTELQPRIRDEIIRDLKDTRLERFLA